MTRRINLHHVICNLISLFTNKIPFYFEVKHGLRDFPFECFIKYGYVEFS
jgi:hypothetical protein